MEQVGETTTQAAPRRMVPRRSKDWSNTVGWTRRIVQAGFVAWLTFTLWQRATAESEGGGSVESFCPFGGFETAWTWITTGRTVPHTHSANLVLAGIVVILAIVARGFFCGWICVLGSLQDAVRAVGRRIEHAVPGLRGVRALVARRAPWLGRVDRWLSWGRYAVLAWALGGAAVTGTMVFREIDPWSALIGIIEFEMSTGFVVLIAMLVLSLALDRPFCRYACPLGAVQGLITKASPVAIERDAATCLGCDICNEACPMHIPVNTRTRVTDAECIGCLRCVAACPSRDALALRVALPIRAITSSETEQASC